MQISGGADLFIGYGGVVERPSVAAEAEWYVYDHAVLAKALSRYQVAMIGSGAWACAAARMIAQNTRCDDPLDEVRQQECRGRRAGSTGAWLQAGRQGGPAGSVLLQSTAGERQSASGCSSLAWEVVHRHAVFGPQTILNPPVLICPLSPGPSLSHFPVCAQFEDEVRMWVYDEDVDGRKLSDVINETQQNPKYFPGIELGPNVRAVTSLEEAVKGADLLVFCAPHQFMKGICKQLLGKVKPGAAAISLIKGMRVTPEGPQLISQMVRRNLGIDCSVLMGANIATVSVAWGRARRACVTGPWAGCGAMGRR